MIDYWRRSTFLVLTLIALTACGEAVSQAELVQATTPILETALPTLTPETSATPRPTETATLVPTPQPSPTSQEPTITPTPDIPLGQVRDGPDAGAVEVWVGEWVTPPLDEGFDPANIVVENNQVHYRSEGLTQVWSTEAQAWVFPETFYSELGKVVPVSLMGGRLKIADQAAAWQAHQDMVLAMLNNPGSADYLQAVYGKDQLTWDDLAVRDEQGNVVAYEFKTPTVNGTKICPTFLFVTDYMDAHGYSLCDYMPSNVEAVKVSSPLWIVAGPKEWSANVSHFVTNKTLGKERMLFGYWASHGPRITNEGRFVWIGATQEYFDERSARSSNLGGRDGDQIDANLASAYVASTIKTYEVVAPGMESVTAVPLNVYPDYSSRVILAGVTQQDIYNYIQPNLFSQ